MDKPIDYCPTQGGTFHAYEPEFRNGDKWERIQTNRVWHGGIPAPLFTGGIANTIGLQGYAQAMAIAWGFAAEADAAGREITVRVVKYEVIYDIKAKRIEPPAEPERVERGEEMECQA